MKRENKKHTGTTRPAVYFVFLIVFIIIVSATFKTYDLFKKSKFDGKNTFNVAITNKNKSTVIAVSPKEKTITQISFSKVNDVKALENESVPVDGYAIADINADDPRANLSHLFSSYRNIKTNLTIIDLFRLKMLANSVTSENIKKINVDNPNNPKFNALSQTIFTDPKISDEKISIQITNATQVGGLGAILAKYLTNLGANVVLVNSSQAEESKTKIYFKNKSYTLSKISKILNIEPTNKDVNSISDVTIIIGSDREELFK